MGMVTILLKLKLIEMNNDLIEEVAVHIYYKFSRIIANTAIIKQCCYAHIELMQRDATKCKQFEFYNQVKEKIKAL